MYLGYAAEKQVVPRRALPKNSGVLGLAIASYWHTIFYSIADKYFLAQRYG
jgi:hypothetical protein